MFAKSLASIWIGSFHMYASVARFQRQGKAEAKTMEGMVKAPSLVSAKQVGNVECGSSQFKQSYASVIHGGGGNKMEGNNMAKKKISLSDHELVHVTNSLKVALVKVKNVDTRNNLYRLCREEGLEYVKIHHIGGLWLWLHFQNVESCTALKNNSTLKSLFTTIKPVSKNFRVDERMIWVEILGLPLCAWGSNAFKCIATTQINFISEMVKVDINKEEYDHYNKNE
ncbi:hypothetical protein Tco_0962806, partial [Tanacetum coccineum]